MADVFVSYATEDRERVKRIVEAIEGAGFSVWWDPRIEIGTSFDREIERELEAAACVVVIWSERSIESEWVRIEAQEGLDRGVLLPILLDDVRPPLAFRRTQAAQLVGRITDDELGRVVASVESSVAGTTASRRPSDSYSESSLAVLPFSNLSTDPDMVFFSEGMAWEIASKLASSTSIVVKQPPSLLDLKDSGLPSPEIGQRLAVTHVVEGAVQRSGTRVRITVHLVNVATKQTIWSGQFNLEMTGIFEVQDAIARKVLHALNLQLTVRPDPKYGIGIEAYDAYLRGMYHARTGDWDLAEEWYEKSAGLDPNNPDLWAERARHLHWQMYSGLAPNTGPLRQRHDEYIERALAIDPSHWARARRAIAMFLEDRQYQRAIDELVEIVSDHPNAYTSMMYLAQALGAIDRKSNSHYKAARRYSLLIRDYSMEQTMLVDSGRLEEAHQSIARNQGWAATYHAARLAAIEGDLDSLEALLNKKGMSHFFRTFFTALFSYLRDDFAQAREIISRAKRVSGYQPFLQKHYIALIERDLDGAVEYYAKAIDAFEGMAIIEHRDTCFMNRVFPEFVAYAPYQRILREIGLDSESAAEIKIPELPF